jgi:hypothetical protein
MDANQKQFITTVANCFLRDTELDAIVMKSKTLVNSSIAFNVEETEIRGGEFNKLLHVYNYGRTGEITLEDARYEPALIAINCGTNIVNQASNVYVFEEEVRLDANGNGDVKKTPLTGTKAYVQTSDGLITTKSFSGNSFSMGETYKNKTVWVTYRYNDTVDMITIHGDSFPKTYELVMEVKVFDGNGLKEKIQWIFPRFKPSGNFEMPLSAANPTTTSMTGKVLDDNGIYGYKKAIPVNSNIVYNAITADVSDITLTTGESYALTVYALRGNGIYAPVIVDASKLTFTSSEPTVATVDTAGKIEYVGAGNAVITITYGTLTDKVDVVCS